MCVCYGNEPPCSVNRVVAVRRGPKWRRHLCIVSSPEELPIEFRPTKFGLALWVALVKNSQEPAMQLPSLEAGGVQMESRCRSQGSSAGCLQNPINVPIKLHNDP